MAFVSLIVLGPWPHWWSFSADQLRQSPTTASRQSPRSDEAPQPGDLDGVAPAWEELGDRSALSPGPPDGTGVISTWISRFSSELRRTAVVGEEPRWGWPEFLALVFFASLGLGIARLGLGVWSIQGLRARCQSVDEPELLDMVEILCAELSCSRNVEIRETDELATPATIGWRRPLLLLPTEWRDWNEAERRAVLAHELAHVCRGDFLMGFVVQASLTVHYHNPLAHWLARRLRLEQELAADAWGARLSGGKQSVSHNAGPDGPAPRQRRPELAGPSLPSLSWHLCSENRNAEKHKSNPACSTASFSATDHGRRTVGPRSVGGRRARAVGIVHRAGTASRTSRDRRSNRYRRVV